MIELKYNIDVDDWYRFLPDATHSVRHFAEVHGMMEKDELFGYFYNMRIRKDINRKVDLKESWVLRPNTLHLGATKVLNEAWLYRAGWDWEMTQLFDVISQEKEKFRSSALSDRTLNLLVQAAWFRGEVLFP